MIKKYISKFTIDIAPSIIATIVGAYIVNHYIAPKNDTAKPAAAVASTPDSKPADPKSTSGAKVANIKPAETAADLAGDSAKTKTADKPVVEKASIEKSETAVERRHQPREKAVAKVTPAPVTPAVVAPALATVGTTPAETVIDDHRDANDLARAAIERLSREQSRSQEAARTPDAPRVQEAPRMQEAVRIAPVQQPVPSMQQLPPPIVVATPSVESFGENAPAESNMRRRLRPPGDIPSPLPIDLQADASGPARQDRTTVAEDVLSAAKSVFHSVTPRFLDR